ncbi:MAG TPA: 16S rRNA (guanine(527)-N(7))-methyltransferase RsmG [Fusobacterium sp.]|uniref:16S rRNA (guanine(527)-N(7))-methyltransferase RsmG n=1 Tax=Fusobacterium sp. TaxID=68766 RepID=UPI002F4016E6
MKEYLTTALQKWRISLEERQIEALLSYVSLLLEYNQHTNLTAIREEKAVLEKHILDSLLLQEFIPEEAKTAIDIGTGAGFPGMVLAICNPHIQFTLMDSVGKKTKFLEVVKESLQLENVEVVNARAEDYIQISKRREYYDLGFCRGVSKLAVILEYMIPFLKVGAFFLPQKMVGTEEEKKAENALQALKSCIEEEYIRRLPYSEDERLILKIRKEERTEKKYPRKVGVIIKKPL